MARAIINFLILGVFLFGAGVFYLAHTPALFIPDFLGCIIWIDIAWKAKIA